MESFHVVIDTSVLRQMHFGHADFARLLLQSHKGFVRIYIPQIVLEEQRTTHLAALTADLGDIRRRFEKIKNGKHNLLVQGLPTPFIDVWTDEEVEQNSRRLYQKFMVDNDIELLPISIDHANNAWRRYFDVGPPFNAEQRRDERRKDIPDSWILEAALGIKSKTGRVCALVADGKLKDALQAQGFEVYVDGDTLIDAIENANTLVPVYAASIPTTIASVAERCKEVFEDVRTIVLGVNETLHSPNKEVLFATLEKLGVARELAEHEAKTLVLAKVFTDTGGHYVPTSKELAIQAALEPVVQDLMLRILE